MAACRSSPSRWSGRRATAGDIRVAESYGSDQYSQVEVTSTQLSGGQWVGPTVRSQNGGQDTYLGIYFWNNGTPQLRLYKRTAGTWIQLGNSYNSGPLPAGTQAHAQRRRLQASPSSKTASSGSPRPTPRLTGGAPGIMTYGAATADNWAGGTDPAAAEHVLDRWDACRGCRARWCCRTTAAMI